MVQRLLTPLRENEVLLIVSVSTMLVMLGQGIIGPILPLFAKSLGVSAAAVGLTLSVFAAARLILNIPSGLIADRWGRRILLVGGPLVTGAGSVLSGTANSIEMLLVWRFVAGVGSAMYMTGAVIVVTDIASDRNRGRMLAVNQGALMTGVTLGPAIGGIVAELAGLRAPFYVVGVAAFAAAVWNYVRVPETRTAAPARAASTTAAAVARPVRMLRSITILLSTNFLLISLVTFAVFFSRSGRQTVLPLFADEEIGLGAGGIGAVFAMMAFMTLLLIVPAGMLIDRFGAKATIVPSALISFAAYALIPMSEGALTFTMAAIFLGFGSGILGPAPAAYAAEIAPPDRRGTAMGLFRSVGDLGFVISPPLVGYLVDHGGFGVAIPLNGVLLACSALVFGVFGARRRTRPEPVPVQAAVGE